MIDTKPVLSPETTEPTYLELMAYLGMSRHSGGWQATSELVELCHIEPGTRVLDIGCGVGKTACFLAKGHGCHVVAVDLSPRMISWAQQTARRERVVGRVEFRVADAQDLPFDDDLFDVVMTESVLSFVPAQQQALRELLRVTRPRGYVGLNESSYLVAPSAEMVAFINQTFVGATLDRVDTWQQRLIDLGLEDVAVRTHRLTSRGEVLDRVRWFGVRGLLLNVYHMLSYSASSPANRATLKRFTAVNRNIPPTFYEQYAYGLYMGTKPAESRRETGCPN